MLTAPPSASLINCADLTLVRRWQGWTFEDVALGGLTDAIGIAVRIELEQREPFVLHRRFDARSSRDAVEPAVQRAHAVPLEQVAQRHALGLLHTSLRSADEST
jgi:hypothetical protein